MSQVTDTAVSRESIAAVEPVIRPHIRRTPVVELCSSNLGLDPCPLTLKLELLQHSGSFKVRGAFANLLLRPIPAAGIVAASGGNHGAAIAYAASQLGLPARIFVPTCCSPAKLERIRGYGATLVVTGELYADALEASEVWAAESGALPVHAFDQAETLMGAGTVGLELGSQAPGLDTLVVPVGGGGLLGGISSWYAGRCKLVGVEPELAPTLTRALEAGRPVDAEAGGIAADSLAPKRVGELGFPALRAYVNQVVLVSDEEIRQGQEAIWSTLRIVAEPGGAAALAAVLAGRYRPEPGERVGVVVSGGNTTAVDFDR